MQAELYADASLSLAKAVPPLLVTFTVTYTVVFTALVLGILMPLISSVARELNRKRGLILVLPMNAITGLPEVRAFVLDVIAEAEAASTDRGRSTGSIKLPTPFSGAASTCVAWQRVVARSCCTWCVATTKSVYQRLGMLRHLWVCSLSTRKTDGSLAMRVNQNSVTVVGESA